MSGHNDDFDAMLADQGDDRPGLDELDDVVVLVTSVPVDDDLDDDDPDSDDPDSDDDDDDDEDYPEDAVEDEIDLVVALYREDGKVSALALPKELANDLDELIEQLRRVPGDAGALGVVSIDSDFFVMVRVRGPVVQGLLSDAGAATAWPIARDAADSRGVDIPDDEDDSGPVGDLDMFADAGLSELDVEAICSDLDSDAEDLVARIARKLGYESAYGKVAAGFGL